MRHHLAIALVACFAVSGSISDAAPGRSAGRHGKVAKKAKPKGRVKAAPPVERDDERDDERRDERRDEYRDERPDDDDNDRADAAGASEAPRRTKRSRHERARAAHARQPSGSDRDRVALREEATGDEDVVDIQDAVDDDGAEGVDRPARLRKAARSARTKNWHVAIGPYLWASSVDANVSLGPASVSSGVDFFEIQRHARYGAEVLAEARYGRFSIHGDVMYGVVAIDGAREVGPIMVTLDGTASSLFVDGTAGYRLVGGDQARLSLEARAGVRYQRTAIAGSVNVAGAEVSPSPHVDAAADGLAGAHVAVRPFRRLGLSGTFDVGVFGASTITWSASADASVRLTRHVLLSLGWRTLTTERTNVSIVMHGPRAAVQLMF